MKWIFINILSFLLSLNVTHASNTLENIGDVGQVVLPVSAMGITFLNHDMIGLKEFVYSYMLSTGTVQILKHTIHRERPNHHSQSFPSGHTASSFVSASFLQFRYGWAYAAPAYALAAVTGYSRIEAKKHWTTDVLAGALIGIGSSYLLTNKYVKTVDISPYYHPENDESGISISAEIN